MSLQPLNPLGEIVAYREAAIEPSRLRIAEMRNLVERWHRIESEGRRPVEFDFKPETMWNLIGFTMLVDVEPKTPPVFRYRLHGTGHGHVIGQDLTGKSIQDVRGEAYSVALQRFYGDVWATGKPTCHRVWISDRARTWAYERIALPLFGNDEHAISFLVVSANPDQPDTRWKAAAKDDV